MKNIKMKNIKMKNLLAENMRRFGTKNLKENIKTNSDFNETVKDIMDGGARGENMTDTILAELGDFYTEIYDSGDTNLIRLYNQLRMSADETPDIQRYSANKLFKYLGTTNLKEASYRGDEINTGLDDYFFNNKPFRGYVHPEDMIGDLDIADINRDGKAYARVGQGFLDYLSDADTIRRAQKHEEYNDAIINTNSNMINAAIAKLKQNPSDKMAQSVIRDEISDFWSTID